MSRSLHTWYSLPDLDLFAERETALEGAIELKRLARLCESLNTDTGSVRARLRFRRRRAGLVSFELSYEARLELICQRCLEPFDYDMAARVEMSLVETASVEPHIPDGYEPVFLEGDRFNPAQVVEDELIVSLPLVPRHPQRNQCGRLAQRIDQLNCETTAASPEGETQTDH